MPSIPPGQLKLMEAITAQSIAPHKARVILPYYIGGFFDMLLLGIVISQCVTYLRFIRTDKRSIVALVVLSVASTIAASIVLAIWLSDMFVWNFGSYLGFVGVEGLTRFNACFIPTNFFVQTFYVDRACRLFRHWWPAVVIAPTMIGSTIAGSYLLHHFRTTYAIFTPDVYENYPVKQLSAAWASIYQVLISDMLITVITVYGLYRIRTGWSNTDSRLRKLIIRSFEAQIPALLVALITFILQETGMFPWPEVGIIVETKIYVIGLLVTRNIRANDRTGETTGQTYSTGAKSNSYPMNSAKSGEASRGVKSGLENGNGPYVHTETWQHTDPSSNYHQRTGVNRSPSTGSHAPSLATDVSGQGQAGDSKEAYGSVTGLVARG